MQLNDSTYFTVQLWMVNKLNLKTTERDVFAIIYGFSQDGQSDFHGSLAYMAELTGYSRNSICTALKNLTEKQLIIKDEKTENNIKYCSYKVNIKSVQATCTGVQATCTGVQGALTNNNINTKDSNKRVFISKDINTNTKKDDFLKSANTKKQTNLYSRCISQIDMFTMEHKCIDIRDILIQHLDIAFENKRIRGEKQYVSILNKLNTIHEESNCDYIDIIMYSIEHGYPTFYDIGNKYKGSAVKTESGNKHIESFTKEDEERLHEFQKKLKKAGKQVTF